MNYKTCWQKGAGLPGLIELLVLEQSNPASAQKSLSDVIEAMRKKLNARAQAHLGSDWQELLILSAIAGPVRHRHLRDDGVTPPSVSGLRATFASRAQQHDHRQLPRLSPEILGVETVLHALSDLTNPVAKALITQAAALNPAGLERFLRSLWQTISPALQLEVVPLARRP